MESMSITEVFGEFRTGKTQLSHTLCITAQMPGENGYTGGKVIFLDTENTLYPSVIYSIYLYIYNFIIYTVYVCVLFFLFSE